jgi:alkyl hydroperoxide reductase subunit AhpF
MAMIGDDDRKEITRIFSSQLRDAVTLRFFTQKASPLSAPARQCATCHEAGELLAEVTGMSEKLKLEVYDLVADAEQASKFGIDKIPAVVFEGKNKGVVRYFGIPAGYEFALLIEDLTDLSQGTTHLNAKTRQRLQELNTPVHIRVLVTPT